MNGISDFGAKSGRVVLAVDRYCMLDCGVHQFLFGVGNDGDRACHFARKFSAVYVKTSHVNLPEHALPRSTRIGYACDWRSPNHIIIGG